MDEVQVEQTSFQMPPQEGFTIAHFLTVADIKRSAEFYKKVFGGEIVSSGDGKRTAVHQDRKHLAHRQRWGRSNTGQTDRNAQPTSRPQSR